MRYPRDKWRGEAIEYTYLVVENRKKGAAKGIMTSQVNNCGHMLNMCVEGRRKVNISLLP